MSSSSTNVLKEKMEKDKAIEKIKQLEKEVEVLGKQNSQLKALAEKTEDDKKKQEDRIADLSEYLKGEKF